MGQYLFQSMNRGSTISTNLEKLKESFLPISLTSTKPVSDIHFKQSGINLFFSLQQSSSPSRM